MQQPAAIEIGMCDHSPDRCFPRPEPQQHIVTRLKRWRRFVESHSDYPELTMDLPHLDNVGVVLPLVIRKSLGSGRAHWYWEDAMAHRQQAGKNSK
jgi:hypothetical protein